METFKNQNPQIDETMKTHLVGDLYAFGIWDNDYKSFYENRIKAISHELGKRIVDQKSDEPLEHYEDIEETEVAEN